MTTSERAFSLLVFCTGSYIGPEYGTFVKDTEANRKKYSNHCIDTGDGEQVRAFVFAFRLLILWMISYWYLWARLSTSTITMASVLRPTACINTSPQ